MKWLKLIIPIVLIILLLVVIYKNKHNEVDVYVKAEDLVSPVINLDRESVVLAKGSEFSYGVNATDDVDGDISDKIVREGNLDVNVPGNYEIKYSISDSAGNKAEVIQHIEVRDELKNRTSSINVPLFLFKGWSKLCWKSTK